MPLKRMIVIASVLALGACEMTTPEDDSPGLRNVSPAAIAALPAGIDSSFLIRDANGCYGIAVEQTEPQTGIALLGADGQQVCDA